MTETETKPSAAARLTAIQQALDAGRTVYIRTALRNVKVSPRTAASWAKSGHDLFRVCGGSLYMARGRHWDCIDRTVIEVH